MTKRLQILPLIFLGVSNFALAQIKEEKLILDRKREPEVRKIEKKQSSVKTEKNYPPKDKHVQDSLHLKYDITDVPAVSDFKTSTIQGQDITPSFSSSYLKNYVRFGMGNYGKILGDATASYTLENKMEVGADAHFLSTTGLKKDYPWRSSSVSADVGAFLNYYADKGKANVEARFGLDDYNYYGIYAFQPDSGVDLKQSVNRLQINGFYDYYSNDILDNIVVKTSFLGDHFDAKERALAAKVNLEKDVLPSSSDIKMTAGLDLGVETQDTQFEILRKSQSNFFLFEAAPELKFEKGASKLKIGVNFNYLSAKPSPVVGEARNNTTGWYPMAELTLVGSDRFKFYAGVNGGTKLNSYAEMLEENRYLVSDQDLRATETKYHLYAGIKGDLQQDFKYDISGAYSKINNALFFVHNGLYNANAVGTRFPYDYANTMSAVYDGATLTEVKASVQYYPLQNLLLDGALRFHQYSLNRLSDLYGEDGISTEISAKYSALDQRLLLGAKLFFNTSNTVTVYDIAVAPGIAAQYMATPRKITVPAYADLNLSAEYQIHKNFSIFALGNNLLGTKYQNYYGYKVLGAQFLGGIKINF